MSKSGDAVKREEWREKLERFAASDVSIAEFCRNENVGTHMFHYWSKQLGRGRSPAGVKNSGSRSTRRATALPATANDSAAAKAGSVPRSEPVVRFTWDSRLTVSVPVDCLDTIRCVLEYANDDAARPKATQTAAFRQVVID